MHPDFLPPSLVPLAIIHKTGELVRRSAHVFLEVILGRLSYSTGLLTESGQCRLADFSPDYALGGGGAMN